MAIDGEVKKSFILLSLVLSIMLISTILVEAFMNFRYERWKYNYASKWDTGPSIISENPILMWESRPYFYPDTNRYGFRDYDYETVPKPAGVFRISFIGDSVTWGLKVDTQSNFVSRFADYTLEKHPNLKEIRSLNHGINGYNTIQISELLTSRVLQFEPDRVVYVLCLNDFDLEGGRYFDKPNSFVLEALGNVYIRLRRNVLRRDFHLWNFENNRLQVFRTIVEMKQLLQAHNVGFQVVVLPVFEFKDSDRGFAAYPLSGMHLAIGKFLTEEHIDFIDLLESFRNQEKPPGHFSYDVWHPNEEGHDFIAKQLLEFVLSDI